MPDNHIRPIEESIICLEENVHDIKSDLIKLTAERQRLAKISEEITIASQAKIKAHQKNYELLKMKTHSLEEINKNLSESLEEWKKAYFQMETESSKYREKFLKEQELAETHRQQIDMLVNEKNCLLVDKKGICDDLINSNGKYNEMTYDNSRNLKDSQSTKGFDHLTYILETKQLAFKESQAKLKLAEKTVGALSSDLKACIIKCEILQKKVENGNAMIEKISEEKNQLMQEICTWKTKCEQLVNENANIMESVAKLKLLQDCLELKNTEIVALNNQIDHLKDENSKHVLRIKDRADTQKRSFQCQVQALEHEMQQSRLKLSLAFKERDEMRLRMQTEITKLEQKFNDSQLEMEQLKYQIDILNMLYSKMQEQINNEDGSAHDDSESQSESEEGNIEGSLGGSMEGISMEGVSMEGSSME